LAVAVGLASVAVGAGAAVVASRALSEDRRGGDGPTARASRTASAVVLDKPVWGEPIDAGELLGGDLDQAAFAYAVSTDELMTGLLMPDEDTVVVCGYAYGQARAGAAVVAAVDLGSGEVKWRTDLWQELAPGGDGVEDLSLIGNNGDLLVNLSVRSGEEVERLLVRLDGQGKIVEVVDAAWLVGVSGRVAAVWAGDEVYAARPDALGEALWSAPALGGGWASNHWNSAPGLLETADGEAFVLTADGYVDAETSRPAWFGADVDNGRVWYFLTEDGIALRAEHKVRPDDDGGGSGATAEAGGDPNGPGDPMEVTAFDPASGDELWRFDADSTKSSVLAELVIPLGEGRIAVRSESTGMGAYYAVLDARTGDEAFKLVLSSIIGRIGQTLFTVQVRFTYQLVGLDLPDGEERFSITGPCADQDRQLAGYGPTADAMYVICSDWGFGDQSEDPPELVAYGLDGDDDELWSLEFPADFGSEPLDFAGASVVEQAGRRFVLVSFSNGCQDDYCGGQVSRVVAWPLETETG
jgi:outer membrane protein assembly factor BamB